MWKRIVFLLASKPRNVYVKRFCHTSLFNIMYINSFMLKVEKINRFQDLGNIRENLNVKL